MTCFSIFTLIRVFYTQVRTLTKVLNGLYLNVSLSSYRCPSQFSLPPSLPLALFLCPLLFFHSPPASGLPLVLHFCSPGCLGNTQTHTQARSISRMEKKSERAVSPGRYLGLPLLLAGLALTLALVAAFIWERNKTTFTLPRRRLSVTIRWFCGRCTQIHPPYQDGLPLPGRYLQCHYPPGRTAGPAVRSPSLPPPRAAREPRPEPLAPPPSYERTPLRRDRAQK